MVLSLCATPPTDTDRPVSWLQPEPSTGAEWAGPWRPGRDGSGLRQSRSSGWCGIYFPSKRDPGPDPESYGVGPESSGQGSGPEPIPVWFGTSRASFTERLGIQKPVACGCDVRGTGHLLPPFVTLSERKKRLVLSTCFSRAQSSFLLPYAKSSISRKDCVLFSIQV